VKEKKYKVRCSTDGIINIPKEIKDALGWKINEEVHVLEAETMITDTESFKSIYVQKVSDTEREDYQEDLEDSFEAGLFDKEAEA
tara:strand:+ start:232 stop:486 length:255 start_codon:yes stop_codon:yes gene_type:complete